VLDEHDEGLQEERNPTWQARDVAIERARRAGIPCLLVSPVPSLAALEWAGPRVAIPSRDDERDGWPLVEVDDRSREEPWVTSPVSSKLIAHLRDHTRTVLCVLNTTGRAKRLVCRTCSQATVCERCGAAVAEVATGVLRCGRCGLERPKVCQHCGSMALTGLRRGVNRLRDELEAAAGRPVVEVTGATVGDQPLPAAGVYVGTEAVLHRVRHADVVAFLEFDSELLAPRYRAAEQALALLARAARVVGGRNGGGRLLVQTRDPHHPVVDAALLADPGRIVAGEVAVRQSLGYPPARALALLTGEGAGEYAAGLRAAGAEIAGPSDGRFLVRAADWDALADLLASVPRPTAARVRVEVDPPRI
jgi:primosomal protein N' (replication factor Y)